MKPILSSLAALLLVLWTAGCSHAGTRPQSQQRDTVVQFRMPDIPAAITNPGDRADYLTYHYWDHFNFADTTLIGRADITEQAFADFLSVLPYAQEQQRAVDRLFERAADNPGMLYHFISLAELYLYEPNSPMRNDELFLLVLQALTNSDRLDETDKLRPRALLELVQRNRPGTVAADFVYTLRDGRQGRLSDLKSPCTLIFFNDPECSDCKRVKRYLQGSPVVRRAIAEGRLTLLAVSVEGATPAWREAVVPSDWIWSCDEAQQISEEQRYDLKAIPTLYLLDAGKRVLLKDATVEAVEQRLQEAAAE